MNLAAAQPWHEALVGRPPDVIVTDVEVMWQVCDGGWIYLAQDPIHAGHALITIAVADLDQAVTDLAARGLDGPTIEPVAGAVRKAPLVESEGNSVALIEVVSTNG